MNTLHVKKGDTVLVLAGKDKGKKGKVSATFPKKNRVVVDGVNTITKHKKARDPKDKSGRIKLDAPINASNVMVICSKCNKATRIAKVKAENGKMVRACKKCNALLGNTSIAKKRTAKSDKADKAVDKADKKVAKKEKEPKVADEKETKKKKDKILV